MRPGFLPIYAALILGACATAQEKVTFQDHILPLVEANCAKCHNSDKRKGDLDLTSYGGAIAGGASGKIVVAGDPDSSKIWKVINHLEDPNMPPKSSKLPDKDLAVFKKWILGGLLENLGSKAITGRPTVNLALDSGVVDKPDGPPPMPGELLMEPVVAVKHSTAVIGLAASPWAPVVAIAGQKQIVLYDSDTLELLGVLPFRDEQEIYQPTDVTFSRNGKLVVAGGGHPAKAGRVLIFDITTGERIISVGSGVEFDSALGADLSPDQSKIVFGGPSRVVKVFSTKDGSLLYKMKKHTDWVTAVAFSPNGQWLASADRNGAIVIWDAENGVEIHSLAGHKLSVTALSWRGDSKVLASVSEDGSAKLWEMNEGKQVKTWNAHSGGALSVSYARDGRLATCGRDNKVTAWSVDGTKLRSFDFTNELPVRVTFTHDGGRVVATDWTGKVTVWESKDGRRVGELAANPPIIAEQIATVQDHLARLQTGGAISSSAKAADDAARAKAKAELVSASNVLAKARADLAPKEAVDAKLKVELIAKRTPELQAKRAVSRSAREEARDAVAKALALFEAKSTQFAALANPPKPINPALEAAALSARLAKLNAARIYSIAYYARESIASKKREREKLLASGTRTDKAAAEKLAKQIVSEEKDLQRLTVNYEKLKSAAASLPLPERQSKL